MFLQPSLCDLLKNIPTNIKSEVKVSFIDMKLKITDREEWRLVGGERDGDTAVRHQMYKLSSTAPKYQFFSSGIRTQRS